MNGAAYKEFFCSPVETEHRRYEALRSVFAEEQSVKEVAQRFEISYGTLRNWISEFRRQYDAGRRPPFQLSAPRTTTRIRHRPTAMQH